SRYVDQIVVVGNNRPHLVALIALNRAAVDATLARTVGLLPSGEEVQRSRTTIDLVQDDLTALGDKLARHERVHAFAVLSAPLSVENGELTATLKPRRDRIEAHYAEQITK